MNSSTSDYQLPNYRGIENDLLDIPKITMLDSVKHLIDGIDKEVRRKEWAINTNKEILIKGKDEAIEGLHREIAELEKVLDLIPDCAPDEKLTRAQYGYRQGKTRIEVAKEWVLDQLEYRRSVEKEKAAAFMERMSANPTPLVSKDDSEKVDKAMFDSALVDLRHCKKENVNLSVKLSNVENNQLETNIIFLPNKSGKLVPLKKQVELGKISSGTLLNTVINIPDGYELSKVILSKVEKVK